MIVHRVLGVAQHGALHGDVGNFALDGPGGNAR